MDNVLVGNVHMGKVMGRTSSNSGGSGWISRVQGWNRVQGFGPRLGSLGFRA